MAEPPRTALITGASTGLGRALARALSEQGWQLIVDARDAVALEEARAALPVAESATAIAGDIGDEAHQRALAGRAGELGGLDLIVNNAGTLGASPLRPLLEYPLSELLQALNTNVVAQLGVLQALHAHLKPGARIINVTSDASIEPYEGWGGYGASKAALDQLSAVLASENPDVRVYAVDPGDMRTAMHQAAYPDEDISDRPLPEESVPAFLALLERDLPSGRYRAEDLTVAKV
ncbi:MAG: SDR family NAD(P)-dependent oxidoreductase [Chloroflexota bacterium]